MEDGVNSLELRAGILAYKEGIGHKLNHNWEIKSDQYRI